MRIKDKHILWGLAIGIIGIIGILFYCEIQDRKITKPEPSIEEQIHKEAIIKEEITISLKDKDALSIDDLFVEKNQLSKNATLVIIDKNQKVLKHFTDISSVGTYTVKMIDVDNGKTYETVLKVTSNSKPTTQEPATTNPNSPSTSQENKPTQNKPEPQNFVVSFECDCSENYTSVTVSKNETINEPSTPHKDGYIFRYWSYQNQPYDFTKPVQNNITLKAEFEKPKWTILWVILSEVNYQGTMTTLSYSDFESFKTTGKQFENFVENTVPNLNIVSTFVYEQEPINQLTLQPTFGPTLEKTDVLSNLIKYNFQNYDSVIVIANMQPYISQMKYAGLTWGSLRYSFIPAVTYWSGPNNYLDVSIHEWIHQLESWYKKLGYVVPVLHDNTVYGYYKENENGWKDWYAAYLSNQLTGGPATGIDKNWWQYTPTTGRRP